MQLAIFCHSLLSDWNHGNAHFLRGIATDLLLRGHDLRLFEPENAWSAQNLVEREGAWALAETRRHYPLISPVRYDLAELDLERALDGVDAVLVHEWNDPELVAKLGAMRARGAPFRLLFHDTHHRVITHPGAISYRALADYDGVLAFGQSLAECYLKSGRVERVFVWHEAADTRVFRPTSQPEDSPTRDMVFVGNWGDDERAAELREFFLYPAVDLGLCATVYGVRYPPAALSALERAGVRYGGWLPNFRVPRAFASHRLTVHVPRRPYAAALPGIPTIRPFEAMACGIPLISAPWHDCEGLFREGHDYLLARTGAEAKRLIALLLSDVEFARRLADQARETILARHTCAHRVDELLTILSDWGTGGCQQSAFRGGGGLGDMKAPLRIACFGSSLVSAYWNGAATYYRGIFRALAHLGHSIEFYEPDAYQRQQHRDIADPPWARVVVYSGTDPSAPLSVLDRAKSADVLIKTSGIGVFDSLLEEAVVDVRRPGQTVIFWDVDAPATLARLSASPDDSFRALIPRYDLVLTYGGGEPVVRAYRQWGAQACGTIYNALDPESHHPAPKSPFYQTDLSLLANRLPDREERIDRFFFEPACRLPHKRFLLGGNGWHDRPMPANVTSLGHVYTADHNVFNSSARAVLNVARDSMAETGYSPATRIFEAAGAAACIITDAWKGVDLFFEPNREILVAEDADEVEHLLLGLTTERGAAIGSAARRRALAEHTYAHRALEVTLLLEGRVTREVQAIAPPTFASRDAP